MKKVLVLIVLAGIVTWWVSRLDLIERVAPTEPAPQAQPTPALPPPARPQKAEAVPPLLSELMLPLLQDIFKEGQRAEEIVKAVTSLNRVQEKLLKAPTAEDVMVGRRLCFLMRQAIKECIQVDHRWAQYEMASPSTMGDTKKDAKFFGSVIEKDWQNNMRRLRAAANAEWPRLLYAERALKVPSLDATQLNTSLVRERKEKEIRASARSIHIRAVRVDRSGVLGELYESHSAGAVLGV